MHKLYPTIVLATLNARYIHASLGLRYLLANLDRHGRMGLRAQAVLREYTVSRNPVDVVADLLITLGPVNAAVGQQIVGFGVYIWNVTATTEVLRLLKAARPDVKLVVGGPEVSHETDQQAITQLADHVITGWGDVSFAKLCRALIDGPQPLMKVIAGEQPDLADIDLPYDEYSDADLAHRLLYVEASRGCPFKCDFCLSSLDKTAWAFELNRMLAALQGLYQRGARHFKFVDRTFNLKIDHSARILQFFLDKLATETIERDPAARNEHLLFLHFEVVPDHLPQRLRTLLAQFPPGVLQLEVGVQSFNETVQKTISRRQDNVATETHLRWLLTHSHAHLHADLIFGLPGETLQSFADGFDRLWAIGPHEIQLGLLKRLRGAPIGRHSAKHGMRYLPEPPFTVLQTDVIDASTVQRFARLARYWDLLANSGRFRRTLGLLLHGQRTSEARACSMASSPFQCFLAFSDWLWSTVGVTHRLTPEALVNALFDYLSQQAVHPPEQVRQVLLEDYVASGARASPKALQGLLPKAPSPNSGARQPLVTRQDRHQLK